jgi:hypothetical protein
MLKTLKISMKSRKEISFNYKYALNIKNNLNKLSLTFLLCIWKQLRNMEIQWDIDQNR